MTQERYVEIANGRVFTTIEGGGEAVLLLHGLSFDHRVWRHQTRALRDDFQVICPDLLGFGRSSSITGPHSHTDVLAELVAALGCARVHVVGHSLGGRIAGEFVQCHPEKVSSLTLAAADLGGVPLPNLGPIMRRLFELGKTDIPAAKRAFVELPIFDVLRELSEPFAFFKQMVDDYSGWLFANAWRGLEQRPAVPTVQLLESFRVPTLSLVGQHEHQDFHAIADEVTLRVPGAERRVIPGAGHVPNLEQPELFSSELLQFLKSARAAPG